MVLVKQRKGVDVILCRIRRWRHSLYFPILFELSLLVG